jgi:hypothetical protein
MLDDAEAAKLLNLNLDEYRRLAATLPTLARCRTRESLVAFAAKRREAAAMWRAA